MAGTDQYGYQPSTPGSEVLIDEQRGSTRLRLSLSTTTRGWDYESTVEKVVPTAHMTTQEQEDTIAEMHNIQLELRTHGAAERDRRNQLDKLGPFAPPPPPRTK